MLRMLHRNQLLGCHFDIAAKYCVFFVLYMVVTSHCQLTYFTLIVVLPATGDYKHIYKTVS